MPVNQSKLFHKVQIQKLKNKKYLLFLSSVLITLALSFLTQSCADDPSSLGLKFIPPGETTGVRIFDSFIDTMLITSTNIKKRVNTSGSNYLMVGTSGSYNSKGLLKFNNLTPDYDSAVVNSATLTFKYASYYYPYTAMDSLGQTGFDIYKVQQNLNLTSITLDSVNSGSFGTVSVGSYAGFLTADSQEVSISLTPSMVKDWLENAADTGYTNKNYGIVLTPNGSSTAIKAFYNTQTSSLGLKPKLQIIVTKNSRTDTLTTEDAISVSLVEGTLVQTPERFTLQAGIGYIQTMKFDVSHIPSTATINDAFLYLTIDSANSRLSTLSPRAVDIAYISDTAGIKTTGYSYLTYISGSQYAVRLSDARQPNPFQQWLDGQTNYGMQIAPKNYFNNLDIYSFYDINCSDPNKRPHIIIKYTPRKY